MSRNKNQVHNSFYFINTTKITVVTFHIIIIIILTIIIYSLIFNLFTAKATGRKGSQLCFFISAFFELWGNGRVNISLYGYILECIAYL